jgi:prepilin-type N-terminal cleavage/methylation domain-containing protein
MTLPDPAGDDGFTLVELLVAFVILGILIVPLAGSVITSLTAVDRAQQRTSDSSDAQVLGLYFSSDVQSSHVVGTASACGTPGATPVLRLSWVDPATAATQNVDYITMTGAHGHVELHRIACGQVSGNVIVGRAVSGVVTTSCTDGAGAATTCDSNAQTVGISFLDKGDAATDAPYAVVLSATRRETS